MRIFSIILLAACAAFSFSARAFAQQPPPAVPDKLPFNIPYGVPISLDMAKQAAEAALAEAKKRGWPEAIAVVGPSGDLTYFLKMDDTQLASVTISQNKARTAARFRRETQVFFDAFESGHPYVGTLDPALVASIGGIPLIANGKLIGAIGCSGGTGAQDGIVCKAGAAVVK
ncbi:MAG TPA: heme-binding protein [Candidatus Binatia bacterium]|nr:heme-binding protein [Candidatus Binatia bacterium]